MKLNVCVGNLNKGKDIVNFYVLVNLVKWKGYKRSSAEGVNYRGYIYLLLAERPVTSIQGGSTPLNMIKHMKK